ncbi:germination protein YpeB [Caldanaerobacter subterraneus]|uniref:Germination protein YpeB n=1 Tax=Caldanaerobacter subterraneus TaxID=911092 RepID=A0A7Y2PKG7_9THEO|nr:germination protein YpeB [Caldanaerobacter subterraneus]NNG65650.1 germination protein YpeB [Caldanaerobacter subterraneus]
MLKRWFTAFVLILVLALGAWGYRQYLEKISYHRYLQAQYDRSFYQLISNVENIETSMGKLMVASSDKTTISILDEIWREAFSGQEHLSQLPIGQPEIDNTSKFLVQVGDYAYSLTKKIASGGKLSDEDLKTITTLHNYAVFLGKNLHDLSKKVQGGYELGNLRKQGTKKMAQIDSKILNVRMNSVNQTMTNFPTLIYDGPFSESLAKLTPKGLTGPEISYDRALQIAREFYGKNIESESKYSPSNGKIKTYGVELKPPGKPPVYINVSRKGGHVVWMMDERSPSKVNISASQALKHAKKFLETHGFKDMESTYSMKAPGYIQFNFVPVENEVYLYPDIVKVKVALDNGDIIGFDATAYYMNHVKRKLEKPKLTLEQAREKVNKNLKIESTKLALIPLEGGKEVLAYEFKGTYRGDTFYVYINAINGSEEKILKVIKTEHGDLTM